MARRQKKEKKAEEKGSRGGEKRLKKLQKSFQALEADIDNEFEILSDEYDRDELETLRWDYRLERMEEYGLTEEELQYLVALKESETTGGPAPPAPAWLEAGAKAQAASSAAPQEPTEYQRKSDVDMALIDKYLERHIERDSTSEMARIYKDAFGEELVVPEKLSLVDLTYGTSSISSAHKLTKAEILGTPEEAAAAAAADAAKAEPVAEAAPVAKKESGALQFATAFKRGVPEGAGFGGKFGLLNPLRLWTIPKRFAGASVGRYYLLFAINLVLMIILLLPRLILWPIAFVYRIIKRIVAPRVSARVGPRLQGLQEKLADPSKQQAPPPKPSN